MLLHHVSPNFVNLPCNHATHLSQLLDVSFTFGLWTFEQNIPPPPPAIKCILILCK